MTVGGNTSGMAITPISKTLKRATPGLRLGLASQYATGVANSNKHKVVTLASLMLTQNGLSMSDISDGSIILSLLVSLVAVVFYGIIEKPTIWLAFK